LSEGGGATAPFGFDSEAGLWPERTPVLRENDGEILAAGRIVVQSGKRAKRAIIASQSTRRFARLAQILRYAKNACSRMTIKLRHYRKSGSVSVSMAAIHAVYYNFARIHKTLRITPAMAAGLSDHIWSLEEIALLAK
jgi:hypothetical protein